VAAAAFPFFGVRSEAFSLHDIYVRTVRDAERQVRP